MEDKQLQSYVIGTREDVAAIKEKIDNLCNCVASYDKRIRALEQKPARRWDTIVSTFLAAAVAAVISIFTKQQ